jgi:hypothetical protein
MQSFNCLASTGLQCILNLMECIILVPGVRARSYLGDSWNLCYGPMAIVPTNANPYDQPLSSKFVREYVSLTRIRRVGRVEEVVDGKQVPFSVFAGIPLEGPLFSILAFGVTCSLYVINAM